MTPGSGKNAAVGPSGPSVSTTPASSQPITTKRTTRSTAQGPMALRADVEMENYAVKDARSGLKYLESKLLCVIGEPINSEHLITTLFNISQLKNVSKAAMEVIRAVAYLIGEQENMKSAKMISTQVKEMI
ncbi:hypothetical protein PAXRUDRAFT_172532 [Paxillus rubicundulus Ve08.2h10]|uniref:Uncharacterized protein n=1 Tax=Paxillus rubicundulus Ve08.2h10 TaxID=930991 RepID=A0A0D0D633_9AGAM|nr:hypothetical protein PAXRUDRAFT_172532 [Paxillus rubicundulus Ve08.2h10]